MRRRIGGGAAFFIAVTLAVPAVRAGSSFTFTTLAGTAGATVNSADGVGAAAQFDAPRGVAMDGAGNLYVGDTSNNTIRKVAPDGRVTTLAGTAGSGGYADGNGETARFNEPFGVAVDANGTLYVADASNNAIRKVTSGGVVSTLAGGGAAGTADGAGTAARFDEPRGIAIDATGTLYVADYDNHLIRRISPGGVVTTLAGKADVQGAADGSGTGASFRGPMGIAVDAAGVVYVADTGNRSIRKITADGVVTTLSLSGARLSEPRGIAVDGAGVLYVADYASHTVRSISSSGVVSTLAGTLATPGTTDAAAGTAARFHFPSGVAISTGGTLYIADTENDAIRTIARSGAVSTFAGQAGRTSVADGTGPDARFEDPFSTATDANGVVYVADSAAHVIRRISADGVVTTYAGTPGSFGSDDGTGFNARFYSPFGVAVDAAGTVYVADSFNSTIRKIALGGVVTTLAGTPLARGSADGTGAAARFDQPFGIAVDGGGTVYVSDATQNTIRKITPAGVVTTLAGTAGAVGQHGWDGDRSTVRGALRHRRRYRRHGLCRRPRQSHDPQGHRDGHGHDAGRHGGKRRPRGRQRRSRAIPVSVGHHREP